MISTWLKCWALCLRIDQKSLTGGDGFEAIFPPLHTQQMSYLIMPQFDSEDRGSGRIAQPLAPALFHAAALGLLLWGAHNAGMIRLTDTTATQQGVSRNAE